MMMIIIIIIIIIHVNRCCNKWREQCGQKEAEKILKYKDLIIEIQRMWNVKARVIPVIAGETGTVSESLRQYLNNVPGKYANEELQKTTILGHCTRTAEC